ncbi:hypothetical protein GWI33_017788 [Rhynchophorus ferrugineus]|uniref:Uncharacterized protein n=1 Tax=Rhynchophorus ferrugineus TaxID=354439 RepID=A0A834I8L0_RHYFE|nr:hypothetical protein GWI33_017788 [Rhynchophorus ferrugineus]
MSSSTLIYPQKKSLPHEHSSTYPYTNGFEVLPTYDTHIVSLNESEITFDCVRHVMYHEANRPDESPIRNKRILMLPPATPRPLPLTKKTPDDGCRYMRADKNCQFGMEGRNEEFKRDSLFPSSNMDLDNICGSCFILWWMEKITIRLISSSFFWGGRDIVYCNI